MDSRELKDRELRSWTAVAPGWRKNDAALREATQGVTARMLDLAQLAPGHKVLDIACGTGEPAIPAAQRVAPDGFVAGTDLVPEMIAFAREKAATLRVTNIEFRVMDAESLLLNPDSVDAVTIRWGLMFMPNPLRCLEHAHHALKPGGRLVVTHWTRPERNPWASIPVTAMKRHIDIPTPPDGAPGLHSFADADRITRLLDQAGFRDVALETMSVPMIDTVDGAAYWSWVREMAGPIATVYGRLPETVRPTVDREIAEAAEAQSQRRGKVRLAGETWITCAVK